MNTNTEDGFVHYTQGRVLVSMVERERLEQEFKERYLSKQLDESLKAEAQTVREHISAGKSGAASDCGKGISRRRLKVFSDEAISKSAQSVTGVSREVKQRYDAALKLAGQWGGFRQVPDFKNMESKLNGLADGFDNFSEVLSYMRDEMALSGASKPANFRIAPILLDGPAGVGKTAFAQRLAAITGLPFRKFSAGGMQHPAVLTGTASHWATSQPGEVFMMLASGKFASGVLLIDEADKLNDRSDYALIPALLELLEPESARKYMDESLRMEFDASRLIVLLTSNSVTDMHEALLSRCRVFRIDRPSPEQRFKIGMKAHAQINMGMVSSRRTELDVDALRKLSERNIDLRDMLSAVRAGFANAIKVGSNTCIPTLVGSASVQQMPFGFVPNDVND